MKEKKQCRKKIDRRIKHIKMKKVKKEMEGMKHKRTKNKDVFESNAVPEFRNSS
jgi:hypothetical protein